MNAIVSDIHGNLEALEVVLADLERRQVQHVACLGDFVGYGASPNECIERLRPRCEVSVAGNHDLAAVGRIRLEYFHDEAATAARWTDQQLTPEHREWLLALPMSLPWRGLHVVHASPRNPKAWGYVLSLEDAADEMEAFDGPVCVIGHSHYPGTFVRGPQGIGYTRVSSLAIEADCRYLITVPSVGQPRDGDPRAGYLLVDEPASRVEFVRLEYDVDGAVERIKRAGLPPFLGERLRWGE